MIIETSKPIWMDLCPTQWHDISSEWPRLKEIAKQRDDQKGGYASTKNWTVAGSTHFTGVCGEFCTSMEIGLPIDDTLRIEGDPGYDFILKNTSYDSKTANFWTSPDLKEFINRKKWADIYILVALKNYRWARVVGWATLEQLRAAIPRNYGHGDMLSITCDELCEWKQLGLPNQLRMP